MPVRLPGLLLLLALALAVLPATAGAALPANVKKVIRDYRNDGRIDPCRHTGKDFRDTLEEISADTEQYAPDFPAAVEAALEARARGDCDKKRRDDDSSGGGGAGGATTPAPPAPAPPVTPPPATAPAAPVTPPADPGPAAPGPAQEVVPEPPAPPGAGIAPGTPPPASNRPATALARDDAGSGAGTAALIVLGGLLAAAALAALAVWVMRRFGWGEERLAGIGHAWGEAGYRTGGTWQNFTEWVRLGR